MLDVFPVAAPRRLAAWAAGLSEAAYPAVFLLGATSGIVAAPCGAPAFGAVLTWVATTHSAVLGFVYLFVFSLGVSVVLAAVGVFSGSLGRASPARPVMWIRRAARRGSLAHGPSTTSCRWGRCCDPCAVPWCVVLLLAVGLGTPGRGVAQDDELGIAIGARPPATIEDLDGRPVDLTQIIGKKPVLLEFWATCVPLCAALFPAWKPRTRAAGTGWSW